MELVFLVIFFILFLAAAFGVSKKRGNRAAKPPGSSAPFTYGDHKQGSDHPNTGSYTSWSDSNSGDSGGDGGGD